MEVSPLPQLLAHAGRDSLEALLVVGCDGLGIVAYVLGVADIQARVPGNLVTLETPDELCGFSREHWAHYQLEEMIKKRLGSLCYALFFGEPDVHERLAEYPVTLKAPDLFLVSPQKMLGHIIYRKYE